MLAAITTLQMSMLKTAPRRFQRPWVLAQVTPQHPQKGDTGALGQTDVTGTAGQGIYSSSTVSNCLTFDNFCNSIIKVPFYSQQNYVGHAFMRDNPCSGIKMPPTGAVHNGTTPQSTTPQSSRRPGSMAHRKVPISTGFFG